MNHSDLLMEFDKPVDKPKAFKFIILLVTLLVGIYLYSFYPTLQFFYSGTQNIWQGRTYFYILLFIYPVAGIQGCLRLKKYGWFILSHYTLTAAVIIFIVGIGNLFNGYISSLNLMKQLALIIMNTTAIFLLFKRSILQYFDITKDNKLLFILLTIIFTIAHIVILIVS